jgi:DNA primase
MTAILSSRDIKEQVSLADLLSRLGFQPAKKSGRELFYKSMLRDNDKNPSFCVNDQLGLWFDHGTGKGGNIIDFALAYWKGLDFRQVLEKISQTAAPGVSPNPAARPTRPVPQVKLPSYGIQHIKDINSRSAIAEYLRSRGIFEQAARRAKEVHYYVDDHKGTRRQFVAAGWANEAGGWEVRNKYFKGCLGKKGISFFQADEKSLAVFEGYFNYLSWLKLHPDNSQSALVLNSTAMLSAGIERAKAFSSIDLYFDNDAAGRAASRDFTEQLPYARDKSRAYWTHNDFNELIQAEGKTRVKR